MTLNRRRFEEGRIRSPRLRRATGQRYPDKLHQMGNNHATILRVICSEREGFFAMPVMSILNQAKGGLPVSASFSAPLDGPACLVLSGSVWSGTVNQTIGVQLELDGAVIGSALIFSNGTSTHRAVVPSYIPVKLTFGTHKVTLTAATAATTSDLNDLFDLVLIY